MVRCTNNLIANICAPNATPSWQDLSGTTPSAGLWIKPALIHTSVPVGGGTGGGGGKPPVDPWKPYIGDAPWDAIGEVLFADYAQAGQFPNPQMGRWFGRTIWDATNGEAPGKVLSIDASIRKHRNEWRAILGLPPI